MSGGFEEAVRRAAQNPEGMGEMRDADAVGTAGSEACGDMLRMWVKFREENGRRVVDRATFQAFGCQTAIAVASVAARMIRGKTAEEALALSSEELAAPLGPLPPMKIHCAQLVEQALEGALGGARNEPAPAAASPTLSTSLAPQPSKKIRFL
ncbi:MAG: iron-sulfur cluster assembly scaffold protein [Terrimicrobiaceae bacterium]|nr:iron-sulfur cluster assembly scaffold protein [Terrimicrobiaceae bacterium]